MKLLLKWVYFCAVYSLTHQVTHQNLFGSQVFEAINSPKLTASALARHKVRILKNVHKRPDVHAYQPLETARNAANAKPHRNMHTNDKLNPDEPHPEHGRNALWGYKEMEHYILKGPTETPPPPLNTTNVTDHQPSIKDLEQHFSSTIQPEHLSFYKWLYRSLDNGRINWYDKVIESLANVNFDPPHFDDVSTEFPVPERHRYLYLYLKQLHHYSKNPTTPHTTKFEEDNLRKKLIQYFGKSFSSEYNKFYKWLYEVVQNVDAAKRRLQFATEQSITAADFDRLVKSTPFKIPTKYKRYFVMVNELERRMSSTNHHYWHTTTPDIYDKSSMELSYLREDKRTSMNRELYWQRRYERYYHFTPQPEYEKFYRWFFKENHELNFPERTKGPVPKIIPMYINPKRDDVTIKNTPFKIPILYTVLFAWLDEKKVKNISTTLMPFPEFSYDFNATFPEDSTEAPSTPPTTRYPVITMDPALKEKCESLFHSTIPPWYEQFYSWMWAVNHDRPGFYRRNEAYKTYSDFDYSGEMERTLYPIPEHLREYYGYVHAIERIISSTGHHFKLGMTTPMPPQTRKPTTQLVTTTTPEPTTTTTEDPKASKVPDWEKRKILSHEHLEDEIINFFNMEIQPKHEPYYRWRYDHEMDANKTREKLEIAQNLPDLDFTRLFMYTPFIIPEYHEYQFAQMREAQRHYVARRQSLKPNPLKEKLEKYFPTTIPPKYLLFYDWLHELHSDLKAYYEKVKVGKSLGKINYTEFLRHTPFPIPVVHLKYYAFIKAAEKAQRLIDEGEFHTESYTPTTEHRRKRRSIEASPPMIQKYHHFQSLDEIHKLTPEKSSISVTLEVNRASHNATVRLDCLNPKQWLSKKPSSSHPKYSSCLAEYSCSNFVDSSSTLCLNHANQISSHKFTTNIQSTDYFTQVKEIDHSSRTMVEAHFTKIRRSFADQQIRHNSSSGEIEAIRHTQARPTECFDLNADTMKKHTADGRSNRVKRDLGQYASTTMFHGTVEDDKNIIKKLENYFSTKIPSLYQQFYRWLYDIEQDKEGYEKRLRGFSSLKNNTENEHVQLQYELQNTPFPIPPDQEHYFAFVRRMERYIKSTAHHEKISTGASDTPITKSATIFHGTVDDDKNIIKKLENYFSTKIPSLYQQFYRWLYDIEQDEDGFKKRLSGFSSFKNDTKIDYAQFQYELQNAPFPIPPDHANYFAFVRRMERYIKSTAHHEKIFINTNIASTPSHVRVTGTSLPKSHTNGVSDTPTTNSATMFHGTVEDNKNIIKKLENYFSTKIPSLYQQFYHWLYDIEQDKEGYKKRLDGYSSLKKNTKYQHEQFQYELQNTPFPIPPDHANYFAFVRRMERYIKSTAHHDKIFINTNTASTPSHVRVTETSLPTSHTIGVSDTLTTNTEEYDHKLKITTSPPGPAIRDETKGEEKTQHTTLSQARTTTRITTDRTISSTSNDQPRSIAHRTKWYKAATSTLKSPSPKEKTISSTSESTSRTAQSISISDRAPETTTPTTQPVPTLLGLNELNKYFTTDIGPYHDFYQWLYELQQDKLGYKRRLVGAKLLRENPSLTNYTELLRNAPFAIPESQKQYFAYIYGMDQAIKSTNRYVKWFRATSGLTDKTTHTTPAYTMHRTTSALLRNKSEHRAKPYYRTLAEHQNQNYKRYRTAFHMADRTKRDYHTKQHTRSSTVYTTPDYEKYSKYRTTYHPWIIDFTRETNETLKQKLDVYFTTTIDPKYIEYYKWRYKLIHGFITPIMKELDPIVLSNVNFLIHLNNTPFPIPPEGKQIYGYHQVMKHPEKVTIPLVKGYVKLAASVPTRNYTYPTNDDNIDYYIDYPITSEDPFSTTQPYDTIEPKEMKKLQSYFTTTIEPYYGEFYKWLYELQQNGEGFVVRMEASDNLTAEEIAHHTYTTPFRIPPDHSHHFFFVNRIEEYLKSTDHYFWLKKSSSTTKTFPPRRQPSILSQTTSQKPPTTEYLETAPQPYKPPAHAMFGEKEFHQSNIPTTESKSGYSKKASTTYKRFYNWLYKTPETILKQTTVPIQTTLYNPAPTYHHKIESAPSKEPSTTTSSSSTTHSHRGSLPMYKQYYKWLSKIEADIEGYEEREGFIEQVNTDLKVLKSRTPFPVPKNEEDFFAYVNEIERLRNSTNYVEYTHHPPTHHIKRKHYHTTTSRTPYDESLENKIDKYFPFTYSPEYRAFYRWLYKMRHEHDIPLHPQIVQKIAHPDHKVETPFPIPKERLYEYAYIEYLTKHDFRPPPPDKSKVITESPPTRKSAFVHSTMFIEELEKARKYFPFTWLSRYDAFYTWFYMMIHKKSLRNKTCGKILSTPNFEQLYLSSTPFPIPPQHYTEYAMMQYMDNLDSPSREEGQSLGQYDYLPDEPLSKRKKRQISYTDKDEREREEQVREKRPADRKNDPPTQLTHDTYKNMDEMISHSLNDSQIAPRYHLFYHWLRKLINSPFRAKILQKDPQILQRIDDALIEKYSKTTNFPIPDAELKNYYYIKLLRELHANSSSTYAPEDSQCTEFDVDKVSFPDYSIEKLKEWWFINQYPKDVDPIYEIFYDWWLRKYHGKKHEAPTFDGPDEISPPYDMTTSGKTAYYRIPPKFTDRFAWLHDPLPYTINMKQRILDAMKEYTVEFSTNKYTPGTKLFWEYLLDSKKAEQPHAPIYEEFYQWFYQRMYTDPPPPDQFGKRTTKLAPRLLEEYELTTSRTYKTMKDTPFKIPTAHTDIVKWIADEDFPSSTPTTVTSPKTLKTRIVTKLPPLTTKELSTKYRKIRSKITNKYEPFYDWLDKKFLGKPFLSERQARVPLVLKYEIESGKKFKSPKTTPFPIPDGYTNLLQWIDGHKSNNEIRHEQGQTTTKPNTGEEHLQLLNEFVRKHPHLATYIQHPSITQSSTSSSESPKRKKRSAIIEEGECPCKDRRNKRSIEAFHAKDMSYTQWRELVGKSISFFIPFISISIPITNLANKHCYWKNVNYETEYTPEWLGFDDICTKVQLNLPRILYSYLVWTCNQNIHCISALPTTTSKSSPTMGISFCTTSTPPPLHQVFYDDVDYKQLIIQSKNAKNHIYDNPKSNPMYEQAAWGYRMQDDAAIDRALARIFTNPSTTSDPNLQSVSTSYSYTTPKHEIDSKTPLDKNFSTHVDLKTHQTSLTKANVFYDEAAYKRVIVQSRNAKNRDYNMLQANHMYWDAPWRYRVQEDVAIQRALDRIFTSRSTTPKPTRPSVPTSPYTIPKHEASFKILLDNYFSTNINLKFYQAYKWFYMVRLDKNGYSNRMKTPKPLQIDYEDVLKTTPFPLPFYLHNYYAEIREIERAIKSTDHHAEFTKASSTYIANNSSTSTSSSPHSIRDSCSGLRKKRHLSTESPTTTPKTQHHRTNYTKYVVEVKPPRTFMKPRSRTTVSYEVVDSKELFPIDTEELKAYTGRFRRTTATYTMPFYPTVDINDPTIFQTLKHFFRFEIEPYYIKFYVWLYRLMTQEEGSVNVKLLETDSLPPARSEEDHIEITNTPFPIPVQYRKEFARIYGEALKKSNITTRAVYTSTYSRTSPTTITSSTSAPTPIKLATESKVPEEEHKTSASDAPATSRKTYTYYERPQMTWVKGYFIRHTTEDHFDPEFILRREEYLDRANEHDRYMTPPQWPNSKSESKSSEKTFEDPDDDITLPLITERTSITTSGKQSNNDPPSVEDQSSHYATPPPRRKRDLEADEMNITNQFTEPDWFTDETLESTLESSVEDSGRSDDLTLPVITKRTSITPSHSTLNDEQNNHFTQVHQLRRKRAAIFSTSQTQFRFKSEKSPTTTDENSYYDVTHYIPTVDNDGKYRRKRAAIFSTSQTKFSFKSEKSPTTTDENSYYDVTHYIPTVDSNAKYRRKRDAILSNGEIQDRREFIPNPNIREKRRAHLNSVRMKRSDDEKTTFEEEEWDESTSDESNSLDDDTSDSGDISLAKKNRMFEKKYKLQVAYHDASHHNPIQSLHHNLQLHPIFNAEGQPKLHPLNKISPLSKILKPHRRFRRSIDNKIYEVSLEKFSTINPFLKPSSIHQNTDQYQSESQEPITKRRRGRTAASKKVKQTSSTLSPSAELFSEVEYIANCTHTMPDDDIMGGCDSFNDAFEITNTFAPDDPLAKGDYYDISSSHSRRRRSVENDDSSDYTSSSEEGPPFNMYARVPPEKLLRSKFKSMPDSDSDKKSESELTSIQKSFERFKKIYRPELELKRLFDPNFSEWDPSPRKLAKIIYNNPRRKAVLDLSLKDLRTLSPNGTDPEDSDKPEVYLRSELEASSYSDEESSLEDELPVTKSSTTVSSTKTRAKNKLKTKTQKLSKTTEDLGAEALRSKFKSLPISDHSSSRSSSDESKWSAKVIRKSKANAKDPAAKALRSKFLPLSDSEADDSKKKSKPHSQRSTDQRESKVSSTKTILRSKTRVKEPAVEALRSKFKSLSDSDTDHSDKKSKSEKKYIKDSHEGYKGSNESQSGSQHSKDRSESQWNLDPQKLAKIVYNNPRRKAVLDLSLKDLRTISPNGKEPEDSGKPEVYLRSELESSSSSEEESSPKDELPVSKSSTTVSRTKTSAKNKVKSTTPKPTKTEAADSGKPEVYLRSELEASSYSEDEYSSEEIPSASTQKVIPSTAIPWYKVKVKDPGANALQSKFKHMPEKLSKKILNDPKRKIFSDLSLRDLRTLSPNGSE